MRPQQTGRCHKQPQKKAVLYRTACCNFYVPGLFTIGTGTGGATIAICAGAIWIAAFYVRGELN